MWRFVSCFGFLSSQITLRYTNKLLVFSCTFQSIRYSLGGGIENPEVGIGDTLRRIICMPVPTS